jgi:urea transport system substrate-binding protein
VIGAMSGIRHDSPSGETVMMDFSNHHLQRPISIGRIRADGQFDVLWNSAGPLRAEPFNPYFKEAARPRMASLA